MPIKPVDDLDERLSFLDLVTTHQEGDDDGDGPDDGAGDGAGDGDGDDGGEDSAEDDNSSIEVTPPPGPFDISDLGSLFLPQNAFSTDEIFSIFGALGNISQEDRQGFLEASLQNKRQLSSGSPNALIDQVRPQVGQIRSGLQSTFDAVSRRLGSSGGGQINRGQATALSQASRQLQGQFAIGQQRGLGQHLDQLSSFRPILASSLPQPFESTQPFDPTQLGVALAGAIGAGVNAFGQPSAGTNTFNPSVNTTLPAQQFGGYTAGPAVFGPFE